MATAPDRIVTAKHLVDRASVLKVRQGDKTWPAKIAGLDADHDLCWLAVEGLEAPAVRSRPSFTVRLGERVYAVESSKGSELVMHQGLVTGLPEYQLARLIQIDATAFKGFSGGGLFDGGGRMLGIITAIAIEGQQVYLVLPGEWVPSREVRPASDAPATPASHSRFQALAWFELGYRAWEARDDAKAIASYQKAIQLRSDVSDVWFYLGLACERSQKKQQAISAYKEAARLRPDYSEGWLRLGAAQMDSDQHEEAAKAFERAVGLKPSHALAWYNLGGAYSQLKQYERAVKAYELAVRLQPDYAFAWRALALAYVQLRQYDQAVRSYQQVLRLKPQDAEIWYALGNVYRIQGDQAKVMEVYERLKTLSPELANKFLREVVRQ